MDVVTATHMTWRCLNGRLSCCLSLVEGIWCLLLGFSEAAPTPKVAWWVWAAFREEMPQLKAHQLNGSPAQLKGTSAQSLCLLMEGPVNYVLYSTFTVEYIYLYTCCWTLNISGTTWGHEQNGPPIKGLGWTLPHRRPEKWCNGNISEDMRSSVPQP